MLNCMLKDGEGAVSVRGSLLEVMADVTILIRNVYEGLEGNTADDFKKFVKELLPEIAFANVEELEKVNKKLVNDAKKELEESLKEMEIEEGLDKIINDLGDVLKMLRDDK